MVSDAGGYVKVYPVPVRKGYVSTTQHEITSKSMDGNSPGFQFNPDYTPSKIVGRCVALATVEIESKLVLACLMEIWDLAMPITQKT